MVCTQIAWTFFGSSQCFVVDCLNMPTFKQWNNKHRKWRIRFSRKPNVSQKNNDKIKIVFDVFFLRKRSRHRLRLRSYVCYPKMKEKERLLGISRDMLFIRRLARVTCLASRYKVHKETILFHRDAIHMPAQCKVHTCRKWLFQIRGKRGWFFSELEWFYSRLASSGQIVPRQSFETHW